METLQTLVRNLAVILLLATFLEMLLPNKSMRGFVQLVMGLFVISAILGPVAEFLHTPLDMNIPAWSQTSPQDLPALAAERVGEKLGKDAVQEQYRQILVNQIRALALGISGVKLADVDVVLDSSTESMGDQPKIERVNIRIWLQKGEIKPVEPVQIGPHPELPASTPETEQVRERVATMMNLPKEVVFVQESNR